MCELVAKAHKGEVVMDMGASGRINQHLLDNQMPERPTIEDERYQSFPFERVRSSCVRLFGMQVDVKNINNARLNATGRHCSA